MELVNLLVKSQSLMSRSPPRRAWLLGSQRRYFASGIMVGNGGENARREMSRLHARHLRKIYEEGKHAVESQKHLNSRRVDPRQVFANNELNLHKIHAYGFDYDYTLAVYKRELNELVYNMAMRRLVNDQKYPSELLSIYYDVGFAIRGLHYDIENCCLLKVDAFNQIQRGTVFRGKRSLTDEQVRKIYGGFSLPEQAAKSLEHFRQLIDLFSLPFAGLLSTIVEHFDENRIDFDPVPLYQDVMTAFQKVHSSGEMHAHVIANMDQFVHKNTGLQEYLERLIEHEKELFIITNSPFPFLDTGMRYMLGDEWRRLFKYVVVSAQKPVFFQSQRPFRLFNEASDSFSYGKVTKLESGRIYAGGNITDFSKAEFRRPGVLYFGDHIFSDLAEPMLRLGWHTAAIVPELASEVRLQNAEEFQRTVTWQQTLTHLIETFQHYALLNDDECTTIIKEWARERREAGEYLKCTFNANFGSMFRTYHNMTGFYRRLHRLSDVYTSRLPNLLGYTDDHTFFPPRHALSHEIVNVVPHEVLNRFSGWHAESERLFQPTTPEN